MEVERKMTSVYPIKAKVISYGSSKSIKTLNRRLHWGERGIVSAHYGWDRDMRLRSQEPEEVIRCSMCLRGGNHGSSVLTGLFESCVKHV